MPLSATAAQVAEAIDGIAGRDQELGRRARDAADIITWDDDEGIVLSQHDLQEILWYRFTHKVIAPPEDIRALAEGLAALLDELGAPRYSAICRSQDTDRMLRTDGDGWVELMQESGVEPPDTLLLDWGDMMSADEAMVRQDVGVYLEGVIDRGELVPGTSGWEDRQEELVELYLQTPNLDGETPLARVHAARIDTWLGHPARHAQRRELLTQTLPLLDAGPPSMEQARTALEPLLWLLGRLDSGVDLTQTHAFSRAFVREAAGRYPNWWDARFGPPQREADVVGLEALHEIVTGFRLARRRGRTLYSTRAWREVREHPDALLSGLVFTLRSLDEPVRGFTDVALAVLLREPAPDHDESGRLLAPFLPERLADVRLGPAVLAASLLSQVAQLLLPFDGVRWTDDHRLRLTDAGRIVACEVLRVRATGPQTGLW